ncbi:MAG: protein translocase subunit SecF [Deltaproteobacteria bacterium]|nr:protein translocase subunit SecF [Deltaproteobacteria bacterium]
MEFFKPGINYDFMGRARTWLTVSAIVCTLSIAAMVVYPRPNWGTDFSGGTEMQITFKKRVSPDAIRSALASKGHRGAEIVPVAGKRSSYIIRIQEVSPISQAKSKAAERRLKSDLREAGLFGYRLSPGGDKLALQFSNDAAPDDIARVLRSAGLEPREVKPFGKPEEHRFEVYLAGIGEELIRGLKVKLGAATVPDDADRVEWVGPKAGAQLRDAGIKALLYAIGLMGLYIAFRFDLRFAPGAIIALFHDVLVALAVLVLSQREITLTTVAAILTITGYSINDTIVVYDRIRENFTRMRERDLSKMINVSINETLGRTVNTVLTTQLSVVAIFIFTQGTVQDFALALFIGFLTGAYSSIFIASPITVWFDRHVFRRQQA